MAETAAQDRSRLESLTGLRFVAALVVFGLHLEGVFYFRAPYSGLTHLVGQGAVGVSFFFVLSGFVLTWSQRPGDRARAFYRRRLARIGPLQVVTWALTGAIILATGFHLVAGPTLASLFLLSPWIPSERYFEAMNVPCWSLGCELFFYALFPLLLPVLRKMTSTGRRLLMAGCLLAPVVIAAVCAPGLFPTRRYWACYFFPPSRLPEFVLGILLALEMAEGRLPRIRLGPASALALVAYGAASWTPSPFGLVTVTLVPFALLIVAGAQQDEAGLPSVWRSRPMILLGTWSFAFYLVHAQVLAVLSRLDPARLNLAGATGNALAAVGLSVGAAALLHHFVEGPAEQALRSPRRRVRSGKGEAAVQPARP